MNLINNIKAHYHNNFIADNLQKNNILEIKEYFKKINQKNSKEFIDLSKKYIYQLHQHQDADIFFDKSLIWLNSFDKSDLDGLKKFLNYYFVKTNYQNFVINSYAHFLDQIMNFYNQNIKSVSFKDLLSLSSLYQYLITLNNAPNDVYIENTAAFFEYEGKNYMIQPQTTACYILMERNPIELYLRYKNLYGKEYALNAICNLDKSHSTYITDSQFELQENKQSWATNSKSWKDPNVLLSHRGLVVLMDELINDPMSIFSNIIAHMKESSINIELNYDVIQNFVNEHQNLFQKSPSIEISQNEKKILQREFGSEGIDIEEFL